MSYLESTDDTEIIRSPNSLQPGKPHRLTLSGTGDKSSLNPGDSVELSALLYADSTGDQEVSLLFVYREVWPSRISFFSLPIFLMFRTKKTPFNLPAFHGTTKSTNYLKPPWSSGRANH